MASKHFFGGHSRSKDVLSTLANSICEATLVKPWTIKSQGRIPVLSQNADFNNYDHVCLRKELSNGQIINLVFYDSANNADGSTMYGSLKAECFMDDGFNVIGSNQIIHGREYYHNYINLEYQTPSDDLDSLPNFAWYWIWVDDESISMTIFGNTGVSGSATPEYKIAYFGEITPTIDKCHKTFLEYAGYDRVGFIYDSMLRDYNNPLKGPLNWCSYDTRNVYQKIVPVTYIGSNGPNSNPLNTVFMAKKFSIAQPNYEHYGSLYSYIPTHEIPTDSLLSCLPGNSTLDNKLIRGDIVSIDRNNCDYIYQTVGNDSIHNVLIKRMESAHDLTAVSDIDGITLEWTNPHLCYGVRVVRKIDSDPVDFDDGDIIFDETVDTVLNIDGVENKLDDTVTSGHEYHYKAFAYASNDVVSYPVSSAIVTISR